METIAELENWMTEKVINNTFTPNHRYVTDEGEGLEELSGIYIWYYIERGNRTNLEFFKSEKDAVNFVYEHLNEKYKMPIQDFIINPLNTNDACQLHQFIIDNKERLKKYFPVTLSSNSTLEKTTEYIVTKNKEIEERSNFTFAIRNEKSIIIGLMILKKIDWAKKMGEFAYCIGSNYEGKGYTSKAVKEMIGIAFNQLQLKTLQIIAHKTNIGSCKVAENCGFSWKKTLLNEFTPVNETPLDMELYELENEK